MDVKLKVVQKAPDKIYAETEMVGMFKQRQGFDGKTGWSVTPQGINEITGDQLEELKFESIFDLYDNYKKAGLKAEVTGTKTVNGMECYEVMISSPSGKSIRQYFGVEDFLEWRDVKTLATPNGPIDQTTDYSDYKDFGGYLIPGKMTQNVMGQAFNFTTDAFKVNTKVSDTIFKKPKDVK